MNLPINKAELFVTAITHEQLIEFVDGVFNNLTHEQLQLLFAAWSQNLTNIV